MDSQSADTEHNPKADPEKPEHYNLTSRKLIQRMDILAYFLGAIATIIAVVAGVESYHHKSFTIWLTCVSGCFYVVGGCCYWQDVEWKRESAEKQAETQSKLTTAQPAVNPLSPEPPHVTPNEIFEEVKRALPYQQSSVESQFVGALVKWKLTLVKVSVESDGTTVAAFNDTGTHSSDMHVIVLTVDAKDIPYLKTAKPKSLFLVSGKIKKVWIYIDLTDTSIVPVAG